MRYVQDLLLDLVGLTPRQVSRAALIGVIGGFLIWNLPPARLYMGDAGSLPPAFAQIAKKTAELVEDGAAVQFGLGKVQLAVLPALKHHRNLTIHSGMVSDPLLKILDGDTVAAIRTGAVLGSCALAEALKDDPRLQMTPVNRTHALSVLSGLAKFTAINSVIEVDLFGQANAEFVGGRQVSGGGGLVDFALTTALFLLVIKTWEYVINNF